MRITRNQDDMTLPISYGTNARDAWLLTNGCTSAAVPTDPSPCVRHEGCSAGHPVVWCNPATGGHGPPGYTGEGLSLFFSSPDGRTRADTGARSTGSCYQGRHMGAQWKQKHREASANARGRIFTKLTKEIMVAARNGADPAMNPRLRMAVDAAKKASMTKDTLDRAIKKGAGLLDEAVQYEVVTYEGFAPNQVPVVVECLTDNRNRTSSNVRALFRKGQLGASGSVTWDFERLGQVEATPPTPATDADEAAIECGAQDLEAGDEGATRFFTEPTDVDVVSKALADRKWTVTSAQLIWKAKNPVTLDDEKRTEVEAFLEALDEDDDVQNLYVGLA